LTWALGTKAPVRNEVRRLEDVHVVSSRADAMGLGKCAFVFPMLDAIRVTERHGTLGEAKAALESLVCLKPRL
jgi:hypothetical protein